jgi:hypothetical protein
VGDERAETYLRVLAEARFRRLLRPPGWRPDLLGTQPAGGWPEALMSSLGNVGPEVLLPVASAGLILTAAGLLGDGFADGLGADMRAALMVRSPTFAERSGGMHELFEIRGGSWPPPARLARPLRVTPIGQTLSVASDRAPLDLHLMTLVRGPAEVAISTVIAMHWPDDGSSADLEMTGAGVQHLPYDQLWMTDDRGAQYSIELDGDGGTTTWQGVARLLPPPAPGIRWLDLIADGTHRLLRLDLDPQAAPAAPAAEKVTVEEDLGITAAERLLATEAEGILTAAWTLRGPGMALELGEITTVLAAAGALAPDSRTCGQLAALCQQLGVIKHGITAPPDARIPGPWASIVAQRQARAAGPGAPRGAAGAEGFVPLATVLPDIDGTRFALAGLSSAGGQSYLHMAASGLPEPARRLRPGWRPGFSVWLREPAGHWHLATPSDRLTRTLDTVVLPMRLTPPLTAMPDTFELEVTGPSARLRATVPVRAAQNMPPKGGH